MARTFRLLVTGVYLVLMVIAFDQAIADAAPCPRMHTLQSSNGHDYVVVFSGSRLQRASFTVTLFGAHHAYAFTLDHVVFDKPLVDQPGVFRSGPTLVENPDVAPLLAASTVAEPNGGGSCATERQQIPSIDEVLHPRSDRTGSSLATQRQIATEAAALSTVVNPELRADIAIPECSRPFGYVSIKQTASLEYPAGALGAGGNATVKVTLSDSGSVTGATIFSSSGNAALDASAVQAAKATSYAAGTFLCQPSGGEYLFRAVFTKV